MARDLDGQGHRQTRTGTQTDRDTDRQDRDTDRQDRDTDGQGKGHKQKWTRKWTWTWTTLTDDLLSPVLIAFYISPTSVFVLLSLSSLVCFPLSLSLFLFPSVSFCSDNSCSKAT
jgi:hypothetical protein